MKSKYVGHALQEQTIRYQMNIMLKHFTDNFANESEYETGEWKI